MPILPDRAIGAGHRRMRQQHRKLHRRPVSRALEGKVRQQPHLLWRPLKSCLGR